MILSKELRKQLNDTDCSVTELIESIEEHDDDGDCDEVLQELYSIQSLITDVQQDQGWI